MLAAPPVLTAVVESVHDDVDRIGDKGECSGQGQPLEHALLAERYVVVLLLLDEVAGRVRLRERLASGAQLRGLGDIRGALGCEDAARREDNEEEEKQEDRVAVGENRDGAAQPIIACVGLPAVRGGSR